MAGKKQAVARQRSKPLGFPAGAPSIQDKRVTEQDRGVNRLAPAAMFDLMAAGNPLAMIGASEPAARTAGRSEISAICSDAS